MRLGQSTVTAIADYQFRSLGEVERVLASMPIPTMETATSLRRLKVSDTKDDVPVSDERNLPDGWTPGQRSSPTKKFKTAGVKGSPVKFNQRESREIRALTNLHHDLADQKEKINTLKVNALNSFKGSKFETQIEKALGLFDKREQELLAHELDAHGKLHGIAENAIPEEARVMFNQVANPIVKSLAGKYKSLTKRYTVTLLPSDQGAVQFQYIVALEKLKNDKGFTYPHFHLVVTCVIDAHNHYHYYVDTGTNNPAPNITPLEHESRGFSFNTASDGRRMLQSHLLVDESIDLSIPTELPRSKEEIEGTKFRNDNVRMVKVNETEHTITFTTDPAVGPKLVDKVVKDILADLAGLFLTKNLHEKMKHKVSKLSTGGFKIVVWVGTPQPRIGKDYQADSHRLAVLQQDLGLDQNQVNQIRRILRGRSEIRIPGEHD